MNKSIPNIPPNWQLCLIKWNEFGRRCFVSKQKFSFISIDKKRLKTAQLECNNVTKGKKQLLLLCERILIASKYLVAYIFFNQKSKVWLRFLIPCIPLIVNFQSKFTAILLLKQSIVNGLTVDVLLSKFFSTRDPLIYLGIVDFNVQLNRMSVELQVPNTTAVWLLCMHRPESRWMNHWRWN